MSGPVNIVDQDEIDGGDDDDEDEDAEYYLWT